MCRVPSARCSGAGCRSASVPRCRVRLSTSDVALGTRHSALRHSALRHSALGTRHISIIHRAPGVLLPSPPVRSGIADYTVELLGTLGRRHAIDVFVASTEEQAAWPPGRGSVQRAQRARLRVGARQDAVRPGRVPDGQRVVPRLHVAVPLQVARPCRAARRALAPRARLVAAAAAARGGLPRGAGVQSSGAVARCRRDRPERLFGPLYYFWPMLGRSSRRHAPSPCTTRAWRPTWRRSSPARPFTRSRWASPTRSPPTRRHRQSARRHGFGPDDVVLSAFGGITPEKRIEPILQALAVARRYRSAGAAVAGRPGDAAL